MMISYKENSISLEASKAKQKEELAGKIIIGEFIRETGVPEFSSEMERLRREVLSK